MKSTTRRDVLKGLACGSLIGFPGDLPRDSIPSDTPDARTNRRLGDRPATTGCKGLVSRMTVPHRPVGRGSDTASVKGASQP